MDTKPKYCIHIANMDQYESGDIAGLNGRSPEPCSLAELRALGALLAAVSPTERVGIQIGTISIEIVPVTIVDAGGPEGHPIVSDLSV